MKRKPGRKPKRYNFSLDPLIIEPFRELCNQGGMSLSRAFEGMAEVFLGSMRPGEDFREEFTRMMTLYFNERRHNFEIPRDVSLPDVDF